MSQEPGSVEYRIGVNAAANSESAQDDDRAATHFFKALQLGAPEFETDWIGWASLVRIFLQNKDYDKAREAYQRLLTFDAAMEIPAIAGSALSGLSHLSLLAEDFEGAISFADKALAVEEIPDDCKCEALYVRGKSLGIQATRRFESGNADPRQLAALIDDALSSLTSCLSLSTGLGADSRAKMLAEQAPEDIGKLQDFRKAIKAGCFIATACYGSETAPELVMLREFRDEVLVKRWIGKLFVEVYYAISPSLASSMVKRPRLCSFVKHVFLDNCVRFIADLNSK